MLDREKFVDALRKQVEPNIFNHSLSLEACMDGLYEYLSSQNRITPKEPEKEEWTLAGLIHDIDFSGEYKSTHPNNTLEVLKKYNLEINENIHNIVKAHAPNITGVKPTLLAHWSIFCADSLTGLITAVAFVYPSRKLADVKLSSVMKKFRSSNFASGTRRDDIKQCESPNGLNLPLETFVQICLTSMQKIAGEIGL